MPESLGILGQVNPSAATLTDAYTPSAGKLYSAISSIIVCNRSSAVPTTFRISVAKGGAADDLKQYIAYDTPIDTNETREFTIGPTVAFGDVIRVYATLATLSFNIFGDEVS
jgi:hypothetical protein